MERIVNILNHHPHHLHTYLDAIFQQDPQLGAPYHNRQVTLYAQYDPTQLLHFLKTSLNYNIPEAYTICEKKDLVSEMVYLLGKMGNNRKALMLIIERLGDVSGVFHIY